MATTPGLWVLLEGSTSKMPDSIFTGARYMSALMPSGRRIPIAKEQIVVPETIDRNASAKEIYILASEANIDAYSSLQQNGVLKEEAAKIVQYGHRGGGLMFLPLETLIHFSKEIMKNNQMPSEAKEIIRQLEDFAHINGMGTIYEARLASPRIGCPNPNIFHSRKNYAQELLDCNFDNVKRKPAIVESTCLSSDEREKRIKEYLTRRIDVFSTADSAEFGWSNSLRELEELVNDFNDTVRVTMVTNTPWRVWGEVKRHRTLNQTTESVYYAIERATSTLADNPEKLVEVFSLPKEVAENPANLNIWTKRINDSLSTYHSMVEMGVPRSDAVYVIPRGLKFGVVKVFDMYNLTGGYMSLRLCDTAEAEMLKITRDERHRLKNDSHLSDGIKSLLDAKCIYTGFCPEGKRWEKCGLVKKVIHGYDEITHQAAESHLRMEISDAIDDATAGINRRFCV